MSWKMRKVRAGKSASNNEAIEKEREWLTEQPEDLSPEKSHTIEWLVERYDRLSGDGYRLDSIPAANFASLPAPERTKLVHEALSKIETERKELLMSIESHDDDSLAADEEND
jgi:hypothetical protein